MGTHNIIPHDYIHMYMYIYIYIMSTPLRFLCVSDKTADTLPPRKRRHVPLCRPSRPLRPERPSRAQGTSSPCWAPSWPPSPGCRRPRSSRVGRPEMGTFGRNSGMPCNEPTNGLAVLSTWFGFWRSGVCFFFFSDLELVLSSFLAFAKSVGNETWNEPRL